MVSFDILDFLYCTKLKNIKAIDAIKKYIGSILPSKPAIIFIFILLTLKITYYITNDN